DWVEAILNLPSFSGRLAPVTDAADDSPWQNGQARQDALGWRSFPSRSFASNRSIRERLRNPTGSGQNVRKNFFAGRQEALPWSKLSCLDPHPAERLLLTGVLLQDRGPENGLCTRRKSDITLLGRT